jgi:hypothetical protein
MLTKTINFQQIERQDLGCIATSVKRPLPTTGMLTKNSWNLETSIKPTNMKNGIIKIVLAFLTMAQLSSCQELKEKSYRLAIEVKDPNGNPITKAKAITGKLIRANEGGGLFANSVTIESDAATAEGKIQLEYKSIPEPDGTISIFGNGFYSSYYSFIWESSEGYEATTRSAKVQAVLRPVKNPIPMFAREKSGFEVKELDEEYQFDFEVGELCLPHGKGVHPDIRVTIKGTRIDNGPDEYEDIDFQAIIRFSNPLDGFIEFAVQPKDGAIGSSFISDYLAPESGYLPMLERKAVSGKARFLPGYWEYLSSLERKAYYFRVRTKTDADGKIISANYGKIYGPLTLVPVLKNHVAFKKALKANFTVNGLYFNPASNDRNVEFDTKRNLIPEGNVQRP